MTRELSFVYDYGQVYLCDAAAVGTVDFLAALDDSTRTGMTVGVAGALVDLLMPLQWNFAASLVFEVADSEPALDRDEWDHMVEFGLQLPSGRLLLEGSGGSGEVQIDVPSGAYRARWSGRGFPAPGEYVPGESSLDSYRLQLWAAAGDEPPREVKRWPGYDALTG